MLWTVFNLNLKGFSSWESYDQRKCNIKIYIVFKHPVEHFHCYHLSILNQKWRWGVWSVCVIEYLLVNELWLTSCEPISVLRIILLSHCNNYHNLKNVGYVLKKNRWFDPSKRHKSLGVCVSEGIQCKNLPNQICRATRCSYKVALQNELHVLFRMSWN